MTEVQGSYIPISPNTPRWVHQSPELLESGSFDLCLPRRLLRDERQGSGVFSQDKNIHRNSQFTDS